MVGIDTRAARTDVRRAVLAVIISSFDIAALMGIGALPGAGDLGEASVRVLPTTAVVGCGSVLTLCLPGGGRCGRALGAWDGVRGFIMRSG
jgi:hypothetical protein